MHKHLVIVLAVSLGATACERASSSEPDQLAQAGQGTATAPAATPAQIPADAGVLGRAASRQVTSPATGAPPSTAGTAAAGSGARASAAGGAGASGGHAEAGMSAMAGSHAGTHAAGSGASGMSAAAMPNTGSLPPVDDLETMGPFKTKIQNGTGPGGNYRMDHPEELGKGGLKHPLVLFAAGGGFPENYDTLLRYLASHGFVVLTYAPNAEDGKGLLDGLDWLTSQNAAASGMLSGKLDTAHVAASGHSFGSLATFNAAPDPRWTTTVHLQGGSLDPHDVVKKLRAPAQFICGETPTGDQDGTFTGDMANANCAIDFAMAETPVFYGSLDGAAHIQLTESVDATDALRMRMLGAIGGWLRWWLAGDESQRARYVGTDCELCKAGTGWTVMQKGLN